MLLDEVDEIMSTNLTRMIFEGPEQELEKTVNSQPAIMAISLACLKAWEEHHPDQAGQTVAVAGHSLGEYTSLVASGALDLADGMWLVRERGRLMQYASEIHPGSMAAIIGLDDATVDEICHETGAEIANVNGADQIVISGDRLCVARAADLAALRGAKRAVALKVSGAFHSALMSPAREGLEEALEHVQLRDPNVPIVANFTSTPLTSADQVKEELLAQLCGCVQWKKSVTTMMDSGVTSFIEFGPGRILGGLIKRISASPEYRDREVGVYSVADPSSAMAAVGRNGH